MSYNSNSLGHPAARATILAVALCTDIATHRCFFARSPQQLRNEAGNETWVRRRFSERTFVRRGSSPTRTSESKDGNRSGVPRYGDAAPEKGGGFSGAKSALRHLLKETNPFLLCSLPSGFCGAAGGRSFKSMPKRLTRQNSKRRSRRERKALP